MYYELQQGTASTFQQWSPSPSHTRTSTPAFSPAPPHIQADVRHVRWAPSPTETGAQMDMDMDMDDDHSQGKDQEVDELDDRDSDEDDSDDNAWRSGITLAINVTRGKLGCMYFDPKLRKIFFLEDSEDSELGRWELVENIVKQISPKRVVTCSNADQAFLDILKPLLESVAPSSVTSISSASGSSANGNPIQLEYRSGREFNVWAGKEALGQLKIREQGIYALQEEVVNDVDEDEMVVYRNGGGRMDSGRGRRNAELRLVSFINSLEQSPVTLGCASALLTQLAGARSALGELDDAIQVHGLEAMSLEEVMHINTDALLSLQIFSPESHASIHSNKTKEGLSLLVVSATPVLSLYHPGAPRRGRVLSQTREFTSRGRGSTNDWKAVWSFIFGAVMIRDSIAGMSHRQGVPVMEKLLTSFDSQAISDLGKTITDIIDWEESANLKRTSVKSGVHADLDELRREYRGLPSLLSKVANEIAAGAEIDFADTLSVVYFPQLGYLIAVAYDRSLGAQPPTEVEDWDYQFLTEEFCYFKNDKCRDLDEHYGDILSLVNDREIEILQALQMKVEEQENSLVELCFTLSELDCLLAFAEASRIYDWNRPTMLQDNVIIIKEGRHPLVELCVDAFVCNDTNLVGGRGLLWRSFDSTEAEESEGARTPSPPPVCDSTKEHSIAMVTGANYSGKSIYLKQVALITFMAHLALIGLTDRILVRIATVESITRGSSAFMIDLQQISFALRNATTRSLLIIDEFGKGTESNDGAGLFWGAVEHLARRGKQTPRALIATHFSHVLANKLMTQSLPIFYAHMDVLIQPSIASTASSTAGTSERSTSKSSGMAQQITYLYRLQPGLSASSNAASCALQFGISRATVDRASFVSELISSEKISCGGSRR
ncbi:P-loop containing nucleoside triphosphate hydrolase protein [Meredithblackwellia eburnea MCA 4105]